MRNVTALIAWLLAGSSLVGASWLQVGTGSGEAHVSIVEQSSSGTTFAVDIPGVEVVPTDVDGVTYSRVTIPGAVAAGLEVGRPEVPIVPVLLARPTGSNPALRILSMQTETLSIPRIYPLQPALRFGEAPGPIQIDGGFYSADVEYPPERAVVAHTATWHDLDVVNVQVFPLVVRPARKEIEVVSRITVRVDYNGGSYPASVTDWMQPLYRRLVQNYSELGLGPRLDYQPGTRCLVFCNSEYKNNPDLNTLVSLLNCYGYSTTVTVTQAGVQPEQIKWQIKNKYFGEGKVLRWVLLVGECDEIPPKANYTKDEWHSQVVALSDYWYSDLLESDYECDDYPEIGIARLSPLDGDGGNADLSRQIQKIIDYRAAVDPGDWLTRITLVAHKEDGAGGIFSCASRGAATMDLAFYPGVRDTIMGYISGVDNLDVTSSIDQGTGMLAYYGHARSFRWSFWNLDQFYHHWDTLNIQNLQNGYRTPVVFNVCCSTSAISVGTCLSERWMRKHAGGAVASLGATEAAWKEPGAAQCSAAVRATRDYWSLQPGRNEAPVFDLGTINMLVDAYVATRWPGNSNTMNIYMFMWLGDPAMPVWSGGIPAAATVSYPTNITLGYHEVGVDVRLGQEQLPVEKAQVCLYKPNDFYVSGLTDGNGHVDLKVTATAVGPFTVCATEGHVKLNTQGQPHTPMLPFWATGNVAGPTAWTEYASMPAAPSGKPVKDGGCMAYDAGTGLTYASKGNKTGDFYAYGMPPGTWTWKNGIPVGAEGKQVYKGSVMCSDGNGKLYLTKGNNTIGFWGYDAATNAWTQLTNVPTGSSGKKVKQGCGIAWATKNDVGYAYLLKGYRNEFYRYDPVTNEWTNLLDAPIGTANHLKYDAGSWLVSNGDHYLYAFKAKYHEFYLYDTDADTWSHAKTPMPVPGSHGNKKAKDGSCAAWFDGRLYAFKGGNTSEFWCYFPDGDTWHELNQIPLIGQSGERKKVKAGAALAAIPGIGVHGLKGNKSLEFWLYVPSQSTELDAVRHNAPGGNSVAAGGGPALGGEVPLMDGLEASKPRWNSQGTWVCYSKTDTLTDREQIYQCQYGTSTAEQRVVDMDEDCEEPVYSPDGQYIAFQLDDTASGYYQLCVTPSTDSGPGGGGLFGRDCEATAATAVAAPVRAEAPGSALAVPLSSPAATSGSGDARTPGLTSVPTSRREVCAGPGIGGTAASLRPVWQITYAEADHCYPEWSLDGEWLCYERNDDSGYTQVWRVPAFGGTEQQLTFGNSDHYLPEYLDATDIVFTLSPDTGYDKIAEVNVPTLNVTVLSSFDTDHDKPSPAWDGSDVAAEALDDSGNAQIVRMMGTSGETWLTSGESDIMAPDYGQDNQMISAVRWTGITSQIVWVDAVNGGYYPATDSLAIRDNPDSYVDTLVATAMAVYEREAWESGGLLFGGGRRRPHTGIYLTKGHKHNGGGARGASFGILALDKATPNPVTDRVTIRWQVPVEADVSLRIYNAAGQLVKVLASGRTKPGAYTTVWNGTDAKGRRLANGIYFYALDNGTKRISRKVVLTD